jgi:hypothetical protein
MSGPTKKYTGGNVNFLIEMGYRIALDTAAERTHVRRSDVMRTIVEQWYKNEGMDLDEDVQARILVWMEGQEY